MGSRSGARPRTVGSRRPAESSCGPTARAFIALIGVYQSACAGRISMCRFTPSCSHYAVEAIGRHGARRGVLLTLGRLGRCRPGGPFGYDPVPE